MNARRHGRLGVAGWVALALAAATATAAVRVDLEVQPRTLYVGEQTVVSFTVRGAANPQPPDFPPVEGLEVRSAGAENSFSVVNGRQDRATTFRYSVVPRREGEFALGPFRYEDDGGQVIEIPAVTIQAISSSRAAEDKEVTLSDLLFAKVALSREKVYVQEPFECTLAIYSSQIRYGGMQLVGLPETGLSIAPFQELGTTQEVVEGRIYQVKRFRATARALTAGALEVKPSLRLTVLLPRQNTRRTRDPFGGLFDMMGSPFDLSEQREVELTMAGAKLEVLPLPDADRPAGFSGAVGAYAFRASVRPSELKIGDPLTLTLTIEGRGNIEALTAPAFEGGEAFRAYEPKLVNKEIRDDRPEGRVTYEQIVIPRDVAVTELPAVSFTFFDPAAGRYRTLTQGPFPLVLHPSESGQSRLVQAAENGAAAETKVLGADLVYLKSNVARWRRLDHTPWYRNRTALGLHLLPAAALLVLWGVVRRREKLAGDISLARRVQAPKAARAAVRRAEQALKQGQAVAFYEAVYEALTSYFGHRLNLAPGEVEAARIDAALASAGLAEPDRLAVQELFSVCEQARYGAPAGGATEAGAWQARLDRLSALLHACEKLRLTEGRA